MSARLWRPRHAVPLLALSACVAAAKAPTTAVAVAVAVAPAPTPCPRTVLAPHPFEAVETATPGTQGVVGHVLDASSGMRLMDTVVTARCGAAREFVVVTNRDGWFRVPPVEMLLPDDGGAVLGYPAYPPCDDLAIRFDRDTHYELEETVPLHPDTTLEVTAQLVKYSAACMPVKAPVVGARELPR